tara:strand:- start:2672 stop:3439 length:768 start_codon:yes stop_codon:yes gene_type:complete
MSREVGSGEYYTFNGCFSAASFGTNYLFPTAPMYKDKESYSGRCRVWLKSYVLSGEECRELDRNRLGTYPVFRIKTGTQNNYNGFMGVDAAMGADAAASSVSHAMTLAHWNVVPTYKVMDGNDTRTSGTAAGPIGTYAIAGGAGNLATGDTLTFSRVVDYENAEGLNSQGTRKNVFLTYENQNFHPANAYVIGAPWGQNIIVDMYYNSLLDNGQNQGDPVTFQGKSFWSIVVEPLINEHIPHHFRMEDEKNRQKF